MSSWVMVTGYQVRPRRRRTAEARGGLAGKLAQLLAFNRGEAETLLDVGEKLLALFDNSPFIAFLGGTISPALGASISTIGATSDAYLDARWQMETGCGIFLAQ